MFILYRANTDQCVGSLILSLDLFSVSDLYSRGENDFFFDKVVDAILINTVLTQFRSLETISQSK